MYRWMLRMRRLFRYRRRRNRRCFFCHVDNALQTAMNNRFSIAFLRNRLNRIAYFL